MEIVHVHKLQGTAAKRAMSTTAGLTTAYQKVANSSLTASAVETTGGHLLLEIIPLIWQSPDSETEIDIIGPKTIRKSEAEEGYKAMAAENSSLAEKLLPIALECWPPWKE